MMNTHYTRKGGSWNKVYYPVIYVGLVRKVIPEPFKTAQKAIARALELEAEAKAGKNDAD